MALVRTGPLVLIRFQNLEEYGVISELTPELTSALAFAALPGVPETCVGVPKPCGFTLPARSAMG
jgi:hypothetical protein